MTEETATASVVESEESRQLPLAWLSLLALGLGVVTGFGAVVFRDLIGLIHNVLFAGHAVVHYDANVFTAPCAVGRVGHPGSRARRHRRDLPGEQICA